MTHPQMIAPAWAEQPWPPECPSCGAKPDHDPFTCTFVPDAPEDAPMPIARDLSDLPPADPREGLVPDPTPRFATVLAEQWSEENYLAGEKATALGTPFRHSDAGKCSRAIAYTAAGIPRSDPMDITGVWNTSLGTLIHEQWQDALTARYPDAQVEVTCATVGADGSGHIDAVIRYPLNNENGDEVRPWVTAYELKTVGGFAFKAAVGAQRKGTPAEGPRTSHLLQAALNGAAVDADEVVVGYLAKECISANVAKRFGIRDDVSRFCAEWTFTREQYEPLAQLEAERVAGILGLVDEGLLAARKTPEMPVGAEITDPSSGDWVRLARGSVAEADWASLTDAEVAETGNTWECGYCSYQTLCATTEAGRIPIESVVTIGAVA